MRNPVNTAEAEKKDIERLTEEMIDQIKSAKDKPDKTVYYLICKYKFNKAAAEAKKYKDIMSLDFPKSMHLISPELEAEAFELINRMEITTDARLRMPIYNKLKDICKGE